MNLDLTPVWISLKTASVATIITFFLGVIAARWMLDYRGIGKGLVDGILTSPLVLPPTVVGFLLLLLLGKNGIFGKLLEQLNIDIIFTWYATVIAATVVAFPLMYKTALGAFKQIDPNLIACGRTLGASEWRVFWQIILPLAKPGIISGVLLSFARSLGEFGATLMLAGSIPGKTQTIPIAIFFAAEGGEMDQALVWVLLILGISLSVMMAVEYYSDDGWTRKKRKRCRNLVSKPSNPSIPNFLPISPSNFEPELIVDIHKQLSYFALDMAFNVNNQPLGLLGASGSGKSMTLRCIAGLSKPDRGRIILNNKTLFDSDRKINLSVRERRVGFLFQNYALFPHLTVAENIAFGLPKKLSSLEIKQEVESRLVAIQLTGMSDRYPHELSGGQQQRVALARALASRPDILLLDEPFSALDTYLRDQLEKLLRVSLSEYSGVTLFVTHNLEEAYRVCSDLLVIDQGKIISKGTKQEIFEHPQSARAAQVTGCKNFSNAVIQNSGQLIATDWECTLETIEPIPKYLGCVGIRAHQFIFPDVEETTTPQNIFPCWLAATSETQHRVTLYLKLNSAPTSLQDYHIQAEVFQEKWFKLKARPFPWQIQLHPMRLMVFP
ncbi:molybdate ABC transporter permease subunit [Aphanothece hegewaldii CCALA 016]|uniref:Molybdate ABC transporter permease subunit n=1 Tax=Aphanothece hegewaldii CCALA 016 TaxID=2107694 RepID=A0A2T1LZX7_9CHRO|nr:molybdate ABC transporter permease subunit [Aphanothece hegewaldii]PSF37920.1 molybdate ABC transporter permease subunit [Aphanothece hegewaldii CCALA 016]